MKERKKGGFNGLVLLLLSKEVGELLEGVLGDDSLLPHVGGEVTIGAADGIESSHGKVATGLGGTLGGSVNILDTGKLQDLLGDGCSNDTSTTRSRHKAQTDRAALASELHRDGVGETDVVTPISTTDGDNSKLSNLDSRADCSGNFLSTLAANTNVTVAITNDDVGLEASTLTGRSLLLNGGKTHDLILKIREEVINNLVFLDGDGEEVELLNLLDLTVLHKTANLGDGGPGVLVLSVCTTATAATTTTTFTTTTTTAELTATTTTTSTTGSVVCHLICATFL